MESSVGRTRVGGLLGQAIEDEHRGSVTTDSRIGMTD
jgi:hypothetical protein